MKNLLPILFFFFLLPLSFAQPYESIFGSTSTQWNITHGNLGFDGTDEHFVGKDTLINGFVYKTVEGYLPITAVFKGFLREELTTGKVWYRNSVRDVEHLIVDLTLEVGDSLYIGGNWNPQPGYYYVDSVYLVAGKKQIRFDYTPHFLSEPFVMMEGLTTNMGFRYPDMDYGANFNPELLCVYKNDVHLYGAGPCLLAAMEKRQLPEVDLKVYPNPVQDYFNIDLSENQSNSYEYQLSNVYGSRIQTGIFYSNEVTRINWPEISDGVYLLHLYNPRSRALIKSLSLLRLATSN